MRLESINPATGELLESFEVLSDTIIDQKLALSWKSYEYWKNTGFDERAEKLSNLATILKTEADNYGKIISLEMGKPVSQAIAEVEKCGWVCQYYAENAERMLASQSISASAFKTYVRYDPIGPVLSIMPWNFPFWQVLRFAAPTLMTGNVAILKHASNVPQCATAIEELFLKAGFEEGLFTNLLIDSSKVAQVIEDSRIKAVTLTGSENAGKAVASQAGAVLKKCVLELGGSDPFIVLADADMEKAATFAANARLVNSGQTCIAAKRYIVVKEIAEEFTELLSGILKTFKIGDPFDSSTLVGPMARQQFCNELKELQQKSISQGATLAYSSEYPTDKGFYYPVTLLTDVTEEMAVATEETFGPVASLIVVENEEEALRVANNTRFGLSSSIWSKDLEKAEKLAGRIDAGCVFINDLPKSDPRVPFGGTKSSGFGRELSIEGIREFTNVKSVSVEK